MVITERPRIAVLPSEIAARIAAGEVIERPASVVKELIENSLDAGATRVDVSIEAGGAAKIRVSDDGDGIPPDQVADAFERHATSKLRLSEELYSLQTLGFRGEALSSIAAAADVDLTSRPPEEEAAATARLRDGRLERLGAAAAAPGTTVEVRDLFAALPARRRFLRRAATEARAVARVVADYALAYPSVAFRLESEGRELLRSPGGGALRDAMAAVHHRDIADVLLELSHEAVASVEGASVEEGDRPRATVRGLIGPPSLHRANRNYLHLFVNGRAIGSRGLTAAIEQGYAGLMPAGRHPLAAVAIELPGEQVDVNVHPTKSEVRFRDERFVFAAVRRSVLEALADSSTLASEAPGWLTPWVAPVALAGRAVLIGARAAEPALTQRFVVEAGGSSLVTPEFMTDDGAPGPSHEEAASLMIDGRMPALRPLGQIELTYLVTEAPDGLYLVDQHAAHERVLYEQVQVARAARESLSQPLLETVVVELSPSQAALAQAVGDDLAAVGWSVTATDGSALLVHSVPATLHGDTVRRLGSLDAGRLLIEQLDALEAEERLTGPDRVAATLACRAAVRAGDSMSIEQQRALLEALERAETPQSCPHGRPTMLHLSSAALEKAFGRR
jgi:DNA mismatch repair protein MutL